MIALCFAAFLVFGAVLVLVGANQADLARDLGLDIVIDGIGNVIATMPGIDGDPVMCGSHIDTVAAGGRYDGNLGVLAGLEVIETVLATGIELARPLAVGHRPEDGCL